MKPKRFFDLPILAAAALCLLLPVAVTNVRAEPPVLTLLTWPEYMDQALLNSFQKERGIKVQPVYFQNDDERDRLLLQTNGAGYDLVIVNAIKVDVYTKRDWLAPLNKKEIPNVKYIEDRWSNAFPGTAKHAVPYFWGVNGIGYRADLVKNPIRSWMDLFKPASELQGKIAMLGDSRSLIGMALKALGYSTNSSRENELKEAEQLLLQQKPFVNSYQYVQLDERSELLSGNIVATMMFGGDALSLKKLNSNIEFVLPKEGSTIWIDYIAVLQNSAQKQLAFQFINYLNEPTHAAQLAQYVSMATPNEAAKTYLPADFLENPVIYPSEETLRRSEIDLPLSGTALRQRNKIHAQILH